MNRGTWHGALGRSPTPSSGRPGTSGHSHAAVSRKNIDLVEHRTRIAHTAVTEGGARFYYHTLLTVATATYLQRERRAGLPHVLAGLRDGVRPVAAGGGPR